MLPLVTAALSVVWAMGITAALGFNLTPWTAITAVLVLSVAAGHAVQILKRYYEGYAELGDNRAAVAASLRRIGPVMAIACGIAAAGFASLATFGIPAVRDFGLMAAFGILSTLVLELTFIPAVARAAARAALGGSARASAATAARSRARRDRARGDVRSRPGPIGLRRSRSSRSSSAGILRIEVNTRVPLVVRRDAPVIAADNAIRERFTGHLDDPRADRGRREPDALLDPQVLRGMAALQRAFREEQAITAPCRSPTTCR